MCNVRTCAECEHGTKETIRGNGVTEPKAIYLIRCKFDQKHLKHYQDECDHEADVASAELTAEVQSADKITGSV